MTKTLTEQWRDGTLPDRHYYVQYDKCSPFIKEAYGMIELKRCIDSEKIEVLSSVPSYDEYCNLVFQANKPKNPLSDVMMCYDTEREKKVVERLQEQLKEANEVIKWYAQPDTGSAKDYLEKLGVK